MRGVSYESARDRWRCFHRRGNRTFQLRFPTEREAFRKKIELCAEEGVFPYGKSKKEKGKGITEGSGTLSTLPVGIIESFSNSKRRRIITAGWSTEEGFKQIEFRCSNDADRERIIRHATWTRFERLWERLLREANRFGPVDKKCLERLRTKSEKRIQAELDNHFQQNV